MPKSGEHNVNNVDSFFKVRPSRNTIREGESISFLEKGQLVKQEKRNGVVYETRYSEQGTKEVSATAISTSTTEPTGDITAVIASTGLSGGGASGPVTLSIDSTVATLTGTQTLTNKTFVSPALGTPASGVMTNVTGTASGLTSGKVTVTDSTANTNFPVVFHDESNALLDDTSSLTYNPSSGTLVVPNLNVSGTTTTVNTTNLVISDKLIELSNGATGTPAAEADSGLIIERGDSSNIFIGWDEGSDRVRFATTSSTGSSSTVSFVSNANIQAGRLYGDVTGDVTGNADTATLASSATALATARGISMSGEVSSSSVSFDGTASVVIPNTTIGSEVISNGNIATDAAIAITKLADYTISGVSLGGTLGALTVGGGLNFSSGTNYTGAVARTISVGSLALSNFDADVIITDTEFNSGTPPTLNDSRILTALATESKIEEYGYGTGTVTSVTGGNGLTGSITTTGSLNVGAGTGITVNADSIEVDINGLGSLADAVDTTNDQIMLYDNSSTSIVKTNVGDLPFTNNTGDITSVSITAGTGLTGTVSTTSGAHSQTLSVTGLTVSELAATSLTTSAESFADNDTTLMTSAAIDDRILSYGYSTTTGTVDTSGTPVASEYAKFTDSNTIQGRSYAGVRTDLGLNIGTDVQAQNDLLQSIADLSPLSSENGYVLTYSDSSGDLVLSAPTSINAGTLDGLDSSQFLRSDAADTASETITFSKGISSDGNGTSYTWRAAQNTGNVANNYIKIARITATQSSRFLIELAGRYQAYGDGNLPAMGYIVGQLNNDNNYDLVFYNHKISSSIGVVSEVGQVDVDTTSTDIYIKITAYSEITATAHISDGSITVDSTNTGTSAPTGYTTATEYVVYNSGNDGVGSGLDADLLDGQHGSHYLNYNNFTNTPTIPDFNITSVANGEGLIYNSGTGYWENGTLGPTYNGSTANGLLTYGNSTTIDVESNLTFDASNVLTATDGSESMAYTPSNNYFTIHETGATKGSHLRLATDNSDFILSAGGSVNQLSIYDVNGVANRLVVNSSGLFQFLNGITVSGNATFDTDTLIVDSTNNRVGIGTSSPSYLLHLSGTAPELAFTDTDGTATWRARAVTNNFHITETGAGDPFVIQSGAGANAVVLSSSGNVAIGTSSYINDKLHIFSNSTADLLGVVGVGTTGSTNFANINFRNLYSSATGDSAIIGCDTGSTTDRGQLVFSTSDGSMNAVERMRIESAGDVGIGTNNPQRQLHIKGDDNEVVVLESADTHTDIIGMDSVGSSRLRWSSGFFQFYTGGAASSASASGASFAMEIDENQKVGIGTTSPSNLLHLDGTYPQLRLNATGDTTYTTFGSGTSYAVFNIVNPSTNTYEFRNNGTAQLTIDTSGNVGIGITDPQAKLDVTGSTAAGSYSLQLRSGDTSTSTDAAQIIFSYAGNPYNSTGYAHSIRTRHNAGGTTGNAIDFWLWDQATDTASTLGTKRVMTVDGGGRVGINDASPTHSLDTTGTINATTAYYLNGSQVINSSGNWVGGGNISEFTNDSGYITDITTQTDPKYLRSNADDQSTGVLTVDTLKITNDASDTSRHRVAVYDTGATSYGMMLWNTSGTGGDWATMIYGPYQSNRRISFGKVNNATFADHGDVSEIAYFDLDDSTLRLTADAYVNSNKVWHAGNDGSGTGLDADLLDGNHASAFVRSNFRLSTNASSDANSASTSGIYRVDSGESNIPGGITYGTLVTFNNLSDTGFQIIADYHSGGGSLYWRGGNSSTFSGTGSNTSWFKIWNEDNDGSGSTLDADLLDGVEGASYLRSDADDTMNESLYMNASDSSEKLYFQWQGTTIGDIGGQDTTWLRINQATAKNIYTPRYIRADGGFFVDGSAQGITGDGILRVPNGTYTAPGISFANDTDTGMYLASAGNLFITAGGVPRAQINSNGINTLNSNGYYIDDRRIYEVTSNSSERGGFHPIIASIRNSGRQKYLDEDFNYGTNSVNLYNNAGGSNLVVSRITASDDSIVAPNSSGKVIKVAYNGGGTTSPGFGGVYQLITTEKNHTFVQIFQAKLPSGRTFVTAANSMGNNSTDYFLTSPEGTGKWEWYARVCHAGDGGTFSTSGFIYVTGGSDTAFDWYIANMTQYDVTETPGDYASQTGYYRSNYDVNATLARGLNDDDRIVIEASETKIIGDTVERARLGSYGIRNNVVGSAGAPSYSFVSDTDTGMYRHDTNTIGFSTGGTRMLSIKSDGTLELRSDGSTQGASIQRVGQIQFTWDRDTYGNSNNHAIVCDSDNLIINSYDDVTINLDSNSNDTAETFDVRRHSTSLTGGELLFQVHGDYVYPAKQLRMIDGSAAAPAMSFATDTDLGFYRNGANNMRFSAGNAIRGTWNGDGLVLNGGSLGVNVAVDTTDGVIRAGNDVIAYYSSDERLKENVKPIDNALDKVSKIRGVEFDWIVDKEIHPNEGHDVGVIAQEIEKVLPEVVETRDSGYKAVKYEKIVSLLIEAINEQQQQINELKEKLNG